MNKLSIFSAILYWTVFWVSFYLVLSYITGAHGIREFSGFDGWFGHFWFALSIILINTSTWFFPVYYLKIISYIRKSQRAIEYRDNDPYLYDSSGFLNKIKHSFKNFVEKDKRRFIWHYKDSIRDSRLKTQMKQEKRSKTIESL